MGPGRWASFKGRHPRPQHCPVCALILRSCLGLRDLEEVMAESGLAADHAAIGRLAVCSAPDGYEPMRREDALPQRESAVRDETENNV